MTIRDGVTARNGSKSAMGFEPASAPQIVT